MAWARASIAVVAVVALGLVVASGGSGTDPRTPPALPGLPAPFLGTAVVGSGGPAAAIDAYGDVVDLRPAPAGPALIDNPAARQAAGSVAADTGIVPRVRVGGGPALPLWRADSVSQRYLPDTNVVRTVARFGDARVVVSAAVFGSRLAVRMRGEAGGGARVALSASVNGVGGFRCARGGQAGELDLLCGVGRALPPAFASAPRELGRRVQGAIGGAAAGDRGWLARARPLGSGAPAWAQSMYLRSLLVLRALTDRRSGAVAAGARDGWAYVWPRDAATVALAYADAGYRGEACQVAGFLSRLDLAAAARFQGDGAPVPGRAAEGDAAGWARLAGRAARRVWGSMDPQTDESRRARGGCTCCARSRRAAWRGRGDYRESGAGDYLGNAIAAGAPLAPFQTPRGLVRAADDPGSGLDAAAAWAVRPFPRPALYPAVRTTLLHLLAGGTRFGITPGEGWPGTDPWTAPTASAAWAFATLSDAEREAPARPRADAIAGRAFGAPGRAAADRRAALRLLADLRRGATPAGALPERVGAATGIPRSTTPLAWTHAFAVLALRQLWPPRHERSRN